MPLLERAKFLAIFSQNLDEFFQVRVAGLKDQVAAGITRATPDGRTPAQQLLEIRDAVEQLVGSASSGSSSTARARARAKSASSSARTPTSTRTTQVARRGVRGAHLPGAHAAGGRSRPSVPVHLPPVAQPGRRRARPVTAQRRFARVKVPPLLPRFMVLPDGERFVPLEQVIAAHLDQLFPGMEVDRRLQLPRHPQRRPHARGGGGRRPARRGRARAAPPPVPPRRAPRGRRGRRATRSASCCSASSTSRTTTSTCTSGRSTSAGCGRCTSSTAADLKDPVVSPGDAAGVHAAARKDRRTSSRRSASATCSCTTRTRASPPRSRSSSARRRPTRRCSPSS